MRTPQLKLAIVALAVASAEARAQATPATIGRVWQPSTAVEAGMNQAVLDSLDVDIKAGRYGPIDRMVVIRHGRLVFDGTYQQDYDKLYGDSSRVRGPLNHADPAGPYNYYNPWWHPTYRRGDLHTLQSVTKTVSSVIIGAAITRGLFPSIDTPVLNFFDTTKVANIDDRKRHMTIRHLLTMTGGFDWNESLPYTDPNNTATGLEMSNDWIKYTIDRPMMREPGTRFNYSSGESALLAHIFRQATGIDIEEFASQFVFAPLGIERWYWKRTPSGTADTEGGLYLEAKDLARFPQLFLQNGEWNGARIVSADWVKASITPAVTPPSAPDARKYGYKWWLYPNPVDPSKYIWSGSGFGGQLPMAFPDQDMVVVFNAWNILRGRGSLPLAKTQERLIKAVVAK